MLEGFLILYLSKRLGNMLTIKVYDKRWYVFSFIASWIVFEIIALVIAIQFLQLSLLQTILCIVLSSSIIIAIHFIWIRSLKIKSLP